MPTFNFTNIFFYCPSLETSAFFDIQNNVDNKYTKIRLDSLCDSNIFINVFAGYVINTSLFFSFCTDYLREFAANFYASPTSHAVSLLDVMCANNDKLVILHSLNSFVFTFYRTRYYKVVYSSQNIQPSMLKTMPIANNKQYI